MPPTDNRFFTLIRLKRLCAFIIDMCAVGLMTWAAYAYFKFCDFPAVWIKMAEVNSAGAGASQALVNQTFALFNTAYVQTLLIWLGYEIICQFIFRGATLGKLAMKIRIVPMNPSRGSPLHYLLMTVRSMLKFILALPQFFQGIPLLVAVLVMFANRESQTGYDLVVKTKVSEVDYNYRHAADANSLRKESNQ